MADVENGFVRVVSVLAGAVTLDAVWMDYRRSAQSGGEPVERKAKHQTVLLKYMGLGAALTLASLVLLKGESSIALWSGIGTGVAAFGCLIRGIVAAVQVGWHTWR